MIARPPNALLPHRAKWATPRQDGPISLSGKTLGAYEVHELLGQGGMGEVYLARDTRLGRRVALKFLSEEFTRDAERLHRFQQEARATSALNHPNILTVYELGEVDGLHFIAAELVEGETLRVRLDRGPLSEAEAVEITLQIGSALAAAHSAGVVHRDLKPENVILRRDGYVKVVDFGLAKLSPAAIPSGQSDFRTREGIVLGTPYYMSPEQACGEVVDQRADVWSLGVLFHEMVAGRVPFRGRTVSETIATILSADPPPIDDHERLQPIIRKALSKGREERYGSADAMIADLRALSVGVGRTGSSRFDRRTSLVLVTAAALILALTTVLLFVRRQRASSSASTTIASLAVLPFVNLSGAQDAEFVADGMTEELIGQLAQSPDLRVVSRTSAFAFKGRTVDVREVAQKLGVGSIVEGSVRRSGMQLRISAQLVDARNGAILWSKPYDRNITDLFAIQHDIAQQIAAALETRLASSPGKQRRGTSDLKAYELYVQGRGSAAIWSRARLESAIALFRAAIARDTMYAQAYAGLADSYSLLDHRPGGSSLKPVEGYRLALEAASRALALDSTSAEAYAALGHIYTHLGRFAEADSALRRAFALDPNSAAAHLWYGNLLRVLGKPADAKSEYLRAKEIDPLSLLVLQVGSANMFYTGDYAASLDFAAKGVEVAPQFAELYVFAARDYAAMGRFTEAEESLRKAAQASERSIVVDDDRLLVMALAGRRAEAIAGMERLPVKRPVALMRINAVLGRIDEAVRWADEFAREQPEYARQNIDVPPHPAFESLRRDPRYQRLRTMLSLPPQ